MILAEPVSAVISTGYSSPEIQERLIKNLREWEKKNHLVARSTLLIRLLGLDNTVFLSNLKGWEREIKYPYFERDSTFMETGDSFQTIHFQRRPIRLYYHLVRFQGRPLVIIQIGDSIYELRDTLGRLSFIILISIPGAVLAACLAGWFLARRSFRPIDHMIREANQITAAYLRKRLPRTQSQDELDRLAQTLNEMMDRIESSTRAIQEFSSDISHELKTPLAIIRGEIDLALRRSRTTQDLVQTLRVIEGEVNELIRLVDDLLLLVRSDAKQLRLEKKRMALKPLLEQVVQLFQERSQAKKISLSLSTQGDCEVDGDALYLKRLMNNLVDNAIKFTQEGGKVAVTMEVSGNSVLISVIDNGIGIEPEMQAKVFSRFVRTDQARSHEGAGLGLNIAKAICELHGGKIALESQVGKGTAVTVTIPLH
jgi:heavy metal sensor kinase